VTRSPSRCSSIGTTPTPISSRTVESPSAVPITNAVPRTGCPANGISFAGVKMRMRTSPPCSGGRTKTVSAKFISLARLCICSAENSRASVKTPSWLPSRGALVNTSTTK
jgi:hypothetical protein